MLSRYESWDGSKSIPLTGNRYLIDMHGVVIDTVSGIRNEPLINDLVEISDGSSSRFYKRSVLVALTSKRVKLPFKCWSELNTLPLDGDDNNVCAENLVWKFPRHGLRVNNYTDFSYVPGFTRYSINKLGEVYSHVSGRLLEPYRDQMGYWMYGCQPDVGKRTIIGRHRLLALAFLEYPENVDELDVNHKDGVKDNCELDNLEWGTRKHNCIHAYSTGLRTDNVEVTVLNVFTNETKTYYSLEDCARSIGVDGETVRVRTKSDGQTVFPPGLMFKRKDSLTSWRVIDDPAEELSRHGFPKSIALRHIRTGEEQKFNTMKDCAAFLNLKRATLGWKIKNNPARPIGDYVVI
jgi:hypothetical protein